MRLHLNGLFLLGTCLMLLCSQTTSAQASTMPSVKVSGTLMYDVDSYEVGYDDQERKTDSELRRVKLTLESKISESWDAEVGIKIDDKEKTVSLTNAFIRYQSPIGVSVSVGKTKQPFGLENSTSSKYISTIERSMVTSAFSPGRNYGILLEASNKYYSLGMGLYESNVDEYDEKTYSNSFRFTASPYNSKRWLMHFGINAATYDWGGNSYKIKETAEVHLADKIVISKKLNADKIKVAGIELALKWSSITLQAEAYRQEIQSSDKLSQNDASHEGYYVQAGYFITQDYRIYEGGAFKRVSPTNSYGALEAVARFSKLDTINDELKTGTQTTNMLVGLNYHANDKVRIMLNVLRTESTGPEAPINLQGKVTQNAVSLRLQYDF